MGQRLLVSMLILVAGAKSTDLLCQKQKHNESEWHVQSGKAVKSTGLRTGISTVSGSSPMTKTAQGLALT